VAERNPTWSRDELIVTLNFYLQYSPSIPGKTSDNIAELSDLLNRLQSKLGGVLPDKFRNPNGVYMKLMNFRRFDPDYEGTGLQRGNKDEEVVWDLFASNPDKMNEVAASIRSFVSSDTYIPPKEVISDDEEEGEEGQILTRTHRYRERDTRLARQKKSRFLRDHGSLFCEVCKFDFAAVYGDHGNGFIECHHTKPVSELEVGATTKLSDLALLCSNCHRMIHRKRPWLSVDGLRTLLDR
jgi:5-methylcytosine-specific restriction enzyme A